MRAERGLAGLLALALSLAIGCGERAAGPARLHLYCGAGLRDAVADVAEAFTESTGVVVEADYAGSEVLLSRLKLSGRGDVYMPGDEHYVELARQDGLVVSSRPACYFVPVILVRKGNPKGIRTLRDLLRPDVALALGDPQACAIGRQTQMILSKNGIASDEVDKRVVFRSLTVNELAVHLEVGKADATIVWDAIAAQYAEGTDAVAIPAEENAVSTVPVAVLTTSTQPELARRFADFATGPQGQAIFRKHHYSTEPPRPAAAGARQPDAGGRTEPVEAR
jgi:molybdate transport system substrate-binding protein